MEILIKNTLLRVRQQLLRTVFYTTGRVVLTVSVLAMSLALWWLVYGMPVELRHQLFDSLAYWFFFFGIIFCIVVQAGVLISGAAWLTGLVVVDFFRPSKKVAFIMEPLNMDGTLALMDGEPMPKDYLIFTLDEEEPPSRIVDRFCAARQNARPGEYFCMVPFRSTHGYLWIDTEDEEQMKPFARNSPPLGPSAELNSTDNFRTESWEDYRQYVRKFINYYTARVGGLKLQLAPSKNKEAVLFDQFRKGLICLACVCLSATMSAQSADLIPGYMSQHVPKYGVPVFYHFEKGEDLKRTGDGKLSVPQLLAHGRYYNPSVDAGACLWVTVDNKRLTPQTPVSASASVQEPVANTKVKTVGGPIDTTTYAEKMQNLKNYGDLAALEMQEKGPMTWDVVWYWFKIIKFTLFCLFTVFWFWAGFGAAEMITNTLGKTIVGRKIRRAQENAGSMTFGLSGIFATMYLIQFGFYIAPFPILVEGKCLIMLAAAWVLKLICAKLHPNLTVVKKGGGRDWDGGNGMERV